MPPETGLKSSQKGAAIGAWEDSEQVLIQVRAPANVPNVIAPLLWISTWL